jgi:hypothetical protein
MDFFRRERWHGLGMKHYLLRPWQMKDLVLALYFIALTITFLLLLPFTGNALVITGGWLVMLILPILVFSFTRTSGNRVALVPLAVLYFVYGWARVLSLVDIIRGRQSR